MPHLSLTSLLLFLGRVRFLPRRAIGAIGSTFQSRKFAFATAAVSLVGAKVVHVYAHFNALRAEDTLLWGPSLFFQDLLVLIIQFKFLYYQPLGAPRHRHAWAAVVAFCLAALLLVLATTSLSFFIISGSELQWHNVAVALDSSWWVMLPSGLTSFGVVLAGLLVAAASLQEIFSVFACTSMDILRWAVNLILYNAPTRYIGSVFCRKYTILPQYDTGTPLENDTREDDIIPLQQASPIALSRLAKLRYALVTVGLVAQLFSIVFRPASSSLTAMSWTLPLIPIVDLVQSSAAATSLLVNGAEINHAWANKTALSQPVHLPWLPKSAKLPGFEDWYESDKEHYLAAADPLKISNLDDDPIATLHSTLANTQIRHVVLVILESYRKDVFPVKRDGVIWERLVNSFKNTSLHTQAERKLATLTPNANFITGDYNDGFEHKMQRPRGGINANNAHTTSTYTLKSLTGTICGITPLVVDFNAEYNHHVYQPCLPHIFQALNEMNSGGSINATDDFQLFRWKSMHMQSATTGMDNQDSLMSVFGYTQENIISREYLQSDSAKFGKVSLPEVNYFSLPEVALEDYLRDTFSSATQNKERIFLSHLTSTTHHDFGVPETEQYVPLAANKQLDELSHYMNAVGYSDRWLGKMLEVLEDCGVANETLVVFVGDHGLPLPEGSVSTYGNTNLASSHVPLVFSHPHLPQVNVDDAVTSSQILPTILDLLIESGSLLEPAAAALRGLIQNYEGQSLLRPLRKMSLETGQGDWQYTVINPGGSMLSVRDARQPHWHLIIPLIDGIEWRFANLHSDLHEQNQILAFELDSLSRRVLTECSPEAAKWIEEATAVSGWWIEENKRRWRYGSSAK